MEIFDIKHLMVTSTTYIAQHVAEVQMKEENEVTAGLHLEGVREREMIEAECTSQFCDKSALSD